MTVNTFDLKFAKDVSQGLLHTPKMLSSQYFYDANGDKLFQQIMELPEYYLSRKEYQILNANRKAILTPALKSSNGFNLVEWGAGDGKKSELLLSYLYENGVNFTYFPNDISSNVLRGLGEKIENKYPGLKVEPLEGNYFELLKAPSWKQDRPTFMLYLGSNIGNFNQEQTLGLLASMQSAMVKGDWLLAGFDLKKDPNKILSAYNDSAGVTKEFNLNLLRRINRELDADFDLGKFTHWPVYNPESGFCKSYLVSKEFQIVRIGALDLEVTFQEAETIFTEISRKFSLSEIKELSVEANFSQVGIFRDQDNYFADVLWQKP
ncbi:L-histidine N(alpha)-methyltransferase [Pleomorphovibrio marinus]|uniref:L-histidine N(alpha)-methyltransferase n=1 Tax=Pleomorphovibrio marinus TaxID=2164132 RepID=UPI000E0B1481|nr:L-histidine N(alpha)-methyltransferase [Pleomorphovibrio marinus]